MRQANSIRTLEEILRRAAKEKNDQAAGPGLTAAMSLEPQPHNLAQFFAILYRATEDIRKLKEVENLEEYIDVMVDLQNYFIANIGWGGKLASLNSKIKSGNILLLLKSLAQDFSDEYPEVFLDKELIQNLKSDFNELLEKVKKSDLTKKLKLLLIQRIEELLLVIENYKVYGARDIEIALRSTLWDLYKEQKNIPEEDKNKPIWRKTLSALFALESLLSLGIIAGNYLMPKLKSYTQQRDKYEKIIGTTMDLRDIPDIISDFRALPPSEPEASESEKSDKE